MGGNCLSIPEISSHDFSSDSGSKRDCEQMEGGGGAQHIFDWFNGKVVLFDRAACIKR